MKRIMRSTRYLVLSLALTACGDASVNGTTAAACKGLSDSACRFRADDCHVVEGRRVDLEQQCVAPETEPFSCRAADAPCSGEGGWFEKDGTTWRVEGDCPDESWTRAAELTDGIYFGPTCGDEPFDPHCEDTGPGTGSGLVPACG